jgi:RecA-family ATPase
MAGTMTSDLLVGLRNGAWLDIQEFPPLDFAVPGIIPEGLTFNVGAPKIGKSWLVLGHGLAVASGGRTLHSIEVGPARPALYLALEDGDRRLQDRCRKLLGREPIPALLDYLTRVEPGQVLATIAAWLELHGTRQPLIILDTLGKVMPPALPGESAYSRDYRVGNALRALCDQHPGMALVVNHHDRKAEADDFVDTVSGTHGLAGAADTVIVLTRSRYETAGLLKVTGRDIREAEYALEFKDGYYWQLDGANLEEAASCAREARLRGGVSDRSAEIIAYVAANPPHVRSAEVEEKFGQDARRYLKRLADSGRLRRLSRGLYTSVPSVPMSHSQASAGAGDGTHGTHVTPNEEDPDNQERLFDYDPDDPGRWTR